MIPRSKVPDRVRENLFFRRGKEEKTGRAVGGPRDGVIISASLAWDGFLLAKSVTHHYRWDDQAGVWRWEEAVRSRLRNGRPPTQRSGN